MTHFKKPGADAKHTSAPVASLEAAGAAAGAADPQTSLLLYNMPLIHKKALVKYECEWTEDVMYTSDWGKTWNLEGAMPGVGPTTLNVKAQVITFTNLRKDDCRGMSISADHEINVEITVTTRSGATTTAKIVSSYVGLITKEPIAKVAIRPLVATPKIHTICMFYRDDRPSLDPTPETGISFMSRAQISAGLPDAKVRLNWGDAKNTGVARVENAFIKNATIIGRTGPTRGSLEIVMKREDVTTIAFHLTDALDWKLDGAVFVSVVIVTTHPNSTGIRYPKRYRMPEGVEGIVLRAPKCSSFGMVSIQAANPSCFVCDMAINA